MAALSFAGVFAGYREKAVLEGIDLEVDRGFHCLLGPNGAGKTTLFRTGAGILPCLRGEVLIRGRDPFKYPEVKRVVAYLAHRPALYPGLTVQENLRFWARVLRLSDAAYRSGLDSVVESLGLRDVLATPAGILSRGQAQRVAVARTLLGNPEILFLDEPTTGLDPLAARHLRRLLKALGMAERTIIYSTHNLFEATELAQDLILLREGKIVATGPVESLTQRFVTRRELVIRVSGDPSPVFAQLGYECEREDSRWKLKVDASQDASSILEALVKAGLKVLEFKEAGNPLESIYEGLER